MLAPPDAEMRRPTTRPGDGTNRKSDFNKHEEQTTTTTDVQVRSLRGQFAFAHHFAVVVAHLAWGVAR